jgi:hypothetical protein
VKYGIEKQSGPSISLITFSFFSGVNFLLLAEKLYDPNNLYDMDVIREPVQKQL